MKINPISYATYNKTTPSFKGKVLTHSFNPEISIIKPGETSYPRTFSYDKYSLVMSHPSFLTDSANSSVAYQVLKDIRKSQNESVTYLSMADRFQRFFAIETSKYPDGDYSKYETEFYDNGNPIKEFIDYDEVNQKGEHVTYGCQYLNDGSIFCVAKMTDGVPVKVTYGKPFNKYKKVNYIKFNKNGTVNEIGIGAKHNNDGTTTIDKIFKYTKNNRLVEGGLDVVEYQDGRKEIKNYYRLDDNSDEYINKYAGKKNIDKDGNVTYEGLIYFNQKHFHKYVPLVYFEKEDDNNKLVDKMIKSGEFAV